MAASSGLAVGRELVRRRPGTRVVVFEKEDRVAVHQTGHNSGVVHAGIYYKPGSLKAQLCTRGRALIKEYCAEHGCRSTKCGKLVVAVDADELARFDALEQTARRTASRGWPASMPRASRDIEPHAAGLAALHSPRDRDHRLRRRSRGRIAGEIEAAGGEVRLSTAVTGIERIVGGIRVTTTRGSETVDRLVVCAGLQSDRLAGLSDAEPGPRIVPFRGEYMTVSAAKRDFVRGMVYPVPDPQLPLPRRALHPPGLRRARGGAERRAGPAPRGLQAHAAYAPATCGTS